jgi:hypothetical protein
VWPRVWRNPRGFGIQQGQILIRGTRGCLHRVYSDFLFWEELRVGEHLSSAPSSISTTRFLIHMSSAPPSEPPSDPPAGNNVQKPDAPQQPEASPSPAQDGVEMDTTPDQPAEETWDDIPEEIMALTTDEILTRTRLIDNDIKVRRLYLAINFLEFNSRILCSGAGYEVGHATITTRAKRNEGEDT